MGAAATEAFLRVSSGPEAFVGVAHFAVLAGAYITHGAATLANVMEYGSHKGTTGFVGAWLLRSRLDLVAPEANDWILNGAFLLLPGAFWCQYGAAGVLVAAVAGGVCLAQVCRLTHRGRGGGISLGFAAVTLITAINSQLIFAPEFAFPFMVLGCLGLSAYLGIAFGERDLIAAADLVIVNGSSTGVEAALRGKRVILVGDSTYQRAGRITAGQHVNKR
jgi:uncharacterized membrane protein (UPF0136 family)